jgi:hypothetical protein
VDGCIRFTPKMRISVHDSLQRTQLPPEELDSQVPDLQSRRVRPLFTSLVRRRGGWVANHALQRHFAVRPSVAGVHERTVRSTRAAEVVAELEPLGVTERL